MTLLSSASPSTLCRLSSSFGSSVHTQRNNKCVYHTWVQKTTTLVCSGGKKKHLLLIYERAPKSDAFATFTYACRSFECRCGRRTYTKQQKKKERKKDRWNEAKRKITRNQFMGKVLRYNGNAHCICVCHWPTSTFYCTPENQPDATQFLFAQK